MAITQVSICLVSLPGSICDATLATVTNTVHAQLAHIAFGALSATQILRRIQTDVVLLDSNLPGDEVIFLLQWITEHEVHTYTLVATMNTKQKQEALAHGADVAVQRSELPNRLTEIIDEIMETKQY